MPLYEAKLSYAATVRLYAMIVAWCVPSLVCHAPSALRSAPSARTWKATTASSGAHAFDAMSAHDSSVSMACE